METKNVNISEDSQDENTNNIGQEQVASKKIRFFNSLVDLGLIHLIGQYFVFQQGVQFVWLGPIIFIYYFLFEAIFGVTLGKIITGTKVSDCFGNKPSLIAILIRSIVRVIPFEALSFLSTNGRGWHDYFSGTYVIYK